MTHAPEVHAAISKLYAMGTSHPEFAQQRAEVSRLLDEQFKGRCVGGRNDVGWRDDPHFTDDWQQDPNGGFDL